MDMFKKLDKKIIIVTLLLFGVGILSIYSSTYNSNIQGASIFFYKQLIWFILGILVIALILKFGTHKFMEWAYVIYFINVVLLIVVLLAGVSRGGGYRWLKLGAITFQPSEFAKISIILAAVRFLSENKHNKTIWKNLILISMLSVSVLLIVVQPDLGTGLIFIPVVLAMWYVAGLRSRYLIGFGILSLISSPILWNLLRDYQKQRFLVFLKPNLDPLGAGYTVIQSKIAIGSGRILGKGWLSGTQNMLNFLPERHTDFIFSVIGEEWGFIGSIFVLGLFFVLIKRSVDIALGADRNYDKILATGISVLLSIHVIINIGMAMGIMPAVGLPLPFITYGGSHLMVGFACIGFLLDIRKRKFSY